MIVSVFSRRIVGMLTVAVACFCGRGLHADTFNLTDGKTMNGEVVAMDDRGIILKEADGSYTDPVPWAKLAQSDLKQLQQNPKAAPFVEPFIEVSRAERLQQTQIDIKEVDGRLVRPQNASLIKGFTTSSIGLFLLVILYAGNIYGGYEIAVNRARPPAMVCGVCAVAPIIGQAIFLCLPHGTLTKKVQVEEEWRPPAEEYAPDDSAPAAAVLETLPQAAVQEAQPPEAPPIATAGRKTTQGLPATKTYARGEYTFNRRFFETQLPGFFGVVRSGPEKELVLSVRSSRGQFEAQRIVRVSASDMSLLVQKGPASEEVVVPFIEIQEVQIKPGNA